MLIKDLDNNIHKWVLTGNMAKGKITNKSSLHLQARQILTQIYPTLQILEEVPIPLRKKESLFLDFYLPLKKMCIEVHGEQHYKFIPFYHANILDFMKSQKRDKDKEEWCEHNNITYVTLPYNETTNEWKERIINA